MSLENYLTWSMLDPTNISSMNLWMRLVFYKRCFILGISYILTDRSFFRFWIVIPTVENVKFRVNLFKTYLQHLIMSFSKHSRNLYTDVFKDIYYKNQSLIFLNQLCSYILKWKVYIDFFYCSNFICFSFFFFLRFSFEMIIIFCFVLFFCSPS